MSKSSNIEEPCLNNKSNKYNLKSIIKSIFKPKNTKEDSLVFDKTIAKLTVGTDKMSYEEKKIFTNFLEFGSKTVEKVMIPRSDISAVRHEATLEELNQALLDYSHTRILIYADTLDNIIGFIHIKDLFKIIAKKQEFVLKKLIRKPIISAPSMKLIDLLAEMQRARTHIAVVVDEYGGTDGIVTIEDIMEEIVGPIDDEHDEKLDSNNYKIIGSNSILANARVKVEDIERILNIKLKSEDDEFDTIGGLILAKIGHVPLPGTKILIAEDLLEVDVLDANARGLKKVKLTLIDN